MANMSSANGTVTVTAEDYLTAKRVAQIVFAISSTWGYGTYVEHDFDETDSEIDLASSEFSSSFYGDGRWDFLSNIEYLGKWLEESLADAKDPEKLKNDFAWLKKTPFKIEFTYTDEELGCEYIAQGTASIEHKANTPLKDMIFNSGNVESYDFNADNLMNILGYTEDEAQEKLAYLNEDNAGDEEVA